MTVSPSVHRKKLLPEVELKTEFTHKRTTSFKGQPRVLSLSKREGSPPSLPRSLPLSPLHFHSSHPHIPLASPTWSSKAALRTAAGTCGRTPDLPRGGVRAGEARKTKRRDGAPSIESCLISQSFTARSSPSSRRPPAPCLALSC